MQHTMKEGQTPCDVCPYGSNAPCAACPFGGARPEADPDQRDLFGQQIKAELLP
jgi:hypothetical protein